MKFKSALMTAASGSLGGITASHNRGGDYLRRRVIPVNVNSDDQIAIRGVFGGLSYTYSQVLTEPQRVGWRLYGKNVPVVDRLGDPRQQSGISAFVRNNTARVQGGATPVLDPPVVFTDLPIPDFTLALSGTGAMKEINVDLLNFSAFPALGTYMVYVGRPVNAAVNFFRGPYRLTATAEDGDFPLAIVLATASYVYTAGQKAHVRIVASSADGRISTAGQAVIVIV